jgi:hypothetical protein
MKLKSLSAMTINITVTVFSPNTKHDRCETISKQKQTWLSVEMTQTMMVSQSGCRNRSGAVLVHIDLFFVNVRAGVEIGVEMTS